MIEAIIEKDEAKKQLFARLEPQLKAEAILASNTSTIPITRLAEGLKRPERFCGMHFFNPVRRMQLVEVIRGEKTSDETVATAVAFAKRIGKMPIVINDGPGFLVNRLLFPYMNEALELLHRRGEHQGDRPGRDGVRHADGADHAVDLVGLDTALYAGSVMHAGVSRPRRRLADLPAMVKRRPAGPEIGPRVLFVPEQEGQRPRTIPPSKRCSPNIAAASASSRPRSSPIACSCRCCWRPRGCSRRRSSATCATWTWG